MTRLRRWSAVAVAVAALALTTDAVAASNVGAGLGERGEVSVPTWLYAITGGAVIAASALMSMFVTDRELLDELHDARRTLALPGSVPRAVRRVGGAVGLVGLAAVLVVGFLGPELGSLNLAVLLVYVGGRAGLTVVAYVVGNPWPLLDPWRRLATLLPTDHRSYPVELGRWPAVAALSVLIWIEVAFPVTQEPRLLAVLVLAYTAYTLGGAVAFGREPWFRNADPVSVWYRFYGAVGALQLGRDRPEGTHPDRHRSDGTDSDSDRLDLRPFGSRLRRGDLLRDDASVAFVVLLVWELTFSGVVATSPGVAVVEAATSLGLPVPLVYLLGFVLGFALFLGVYALATLRCRRRAATFLAPRYLARRFAPPLLAIAAGYHFAHFGGLLLQNLPVLAASVATPWGASDAVVVSLPDWFGHVEALAILAGHVLAVWVAHGTAVATFPGRLQAIRSQYPYVVLMAAFTIASLAIVSAPTVQPL